MANSWRDMGSGDNCFYCENEVESKDNPTYAVELVFPRNGAKKGGAK